MSTADATIRAATTDDAMAIATVQVTSWQAAYRGQLPDELLDNLSIETRSRWWSDGWWRQDMARHRLLVAEGTRRIVGFVAIGPSRDEDATSETAELFAIYLEPGVWRTGNGRRLMAAAVEAMQSASFKQATLWVLESNERARRFYERAGWQTDGARKTQVIGSAEAVEVRYRREL